jgi:outer membrane protein OmpA-like peptidoglycan-associated protein
MIPTKKYLASAALAVGLGTGAVAAQTKGASAAPRERIDYLTFAQGAVPVSIGGGGARLGANLEDAVRIIDGNPLNFSIINQADADTDTQFVYALPALTTFDRFAVPNVLETPSPGQTFTRTVEIQGSSESATSGFVPLASATLETHRAKGLVTEIPVSTKKPVRWIRLRLAGGISVLRPKMSYEFSEIIGNGTQESPNLVNHFNGAWRTMALRLQLKQQGALVSGCYDKTGELSGTVTGNILRATGVSRSDKTPSAFVLSIAEDGSVRGVRSDNGGPFAYYSLAVAPAGAPLECGQPPAPRLGCGSIVHGINFDVDSAEIRTESAPILAELSKGLQAEAGSTVVIEGHTSSEGTDEYNLRLSERRARAVVEDLVKRGLPAARVTAAGLGETRPVATNDDESGRSLNRRVEVFDPVPFRPMP